MSLSLTAPESTPASIMSVQPARVEAVKSAMAALPHVSKLYGRLSQ